MDYWQTYGVAILIVGAVAIVGFLIVKKFRGPSDAEVAAQEAAEYEALPKCVCGEIARVPAPMLKRDRGAWDWLRNYFAAPPRYKRVVDMMQPSVFCTAHAHVADAMMDQFIFRIRSEYSSINAKIAADAAGFEQEALLRQVADSLTDSQKRATRKAPPPLRMLSVRTGTDDDAGQ
jgi:hypothetical protein